MQAAVRRIYFGRKREAFELRKNKPPTQRWFDKYYFDDSLM
jgi:hypothetical protein